MKIKTKKLVLCALFAALTAILSQIAIPLEPVPINLATFSVFVAGGMLGAAGGAISMGVYLFIGAVGIPVFSKFRGGLAILAGPTGGYLIGYVAAAWLVGFLLSKIGYSYSKLILSMVAGLIACYTFGTAWFMVLSNTGFLAALTACVFPFLLGDALKIAGAAFLVLKLRPKVTLA